MAPPSRMEGFREGRGWGRIPPVLLHGGTLPTGCNQGYKMNSLYKYYDYLKPEYFNEPTIKISQPFLLNDPFEKSLSEEAVELIVEEFMLDFEKLPNKDVSRDEMRKRFYGFFSTLTTMHGIVSLSETHRNLLMWSHYANSHRGICIGYKSNFLSSLPRPEKENDEGKYSPIKVNYDSCRFDIEKYLNEKPFFREMAIESLSKKSDDWIYEKEHRCIIPFSWADKVILKDSPSSLSPEITKWVMDEDKFSYIKGNQFSYLSEHSYLYGLFNKEPNALLLKSISIDSISELYFGCQIDDDYMNDILNTLRHHNEKTKHIRIYKYTANKNRFELTPERVIL
ncbi:DUF2971 domain-containing protein [Aeromonas jandaei]|uniref:DUF2971 domain-containing protein n=1 Tax=Aeromonas jandaei TaxID=650 RepID=UPI00191C9A9E|nr:DUF2971 domain-containing protein [Aeromonas jandaei]MBL0543901.1 DUF2971 domain-containing protein [Aeromonas jandaei]